jgi:glc operon protein GlcG
MPRSQLDLSYEDACVAADAVLRELAALNQSAVVAVCDSHGELLSLARLDGSPLPSILIAANKAWTAARERKASAAVGEAGRNPTSGFDIGYYGDSRYTGWGGGIPVIHCGVVLGAVAVSGLAEAQDIALAQRGVDAVLEHLVSNGSLTTDSTAPDGQL